MPIEPTERSFQAMVVELASIRGWLCYHTYDSRRSNPGFPDLVMVRGERLIFAELKSRLGRVTREQQLWHHALWAVPQVECYVWKPADWDYIEEVLK